MAKINFSPIRGGFNLSKINNVFQTIVLHLNDKVLYRNSPNGEPNQMETDLDMNGRRLYNVAIPEQDSDVVRYRDIKDISETAKWIESFQPELYVTRTEYDALVARVEALENNVGP